VPISASHLKHAGHRQHTWQTDHGDQQNDYRNWPVEEKSNRNKQYQAASTKQKKLQKSSKSRGISPNDRVAITRYF
jgi:hypothetical protein